MMSSNRRVASRSKLCKPVGFHRMGTLFDGEQLARTLNVSIQGLLFVTAARLTVGELLELTFQVPKRVTGTDAMYRRFTGCVARVIPSIEPGFFGIGVRLICYASPAVEEAINSVLMQAKEVVPDKV